MSTAAVRPSAPNLFGIEVSTEFATSLYGILIGVGSALANVLAGTQLQGLSGGTVSLGALALPALLGIAAAGASALLLPSG